MIKNRKYRKNRRYSKNRPVRSENRKNRKLNRFLTGWGIFFFFLLPRWLFNSCYVVLAVLKWKSSNPKPKLKSLSPHSSPSRFKLRRKAQSHSRGTPQARLCSPQSSSPLLASVQLAARLSQARLKLAVRCSPQARCTLSGRWSLLRFACSALCTAAQVMFYF